MTKNEKSRKLIPDFSRDMLAGTCPSIIWENWSYHMPKQLLAKNFPAFYFNPKTLVEGYISSIPEIPTWFIRCEQKLKALKLFWFVGVMESIRSCLVRFNLSQSHPKTCSLWSNMEDGWLLILISPNANQSGNRRRSFTLRYMEGSTVKDRELQQLLSNKGQLPITSLCESDNT